MVTGDDFALFVLDYRDLNNSVCVLIFGTRFRFNSTAAGLRLQQYCRVIAVGLGSK